MESQAYTAGPCLAGQHRRRGRKTNSQSKYISIKESPVNPQPKFAKATVIISIGHRNSGLSVRHAVVLISGQVSLLSDLVERMIQHRSKFMPINLLFALPQFLSLFFFTLFAFCFRARFPLTLTGNQSKHAIFLSPFHRAISIQIVMTS